MTGENYQSLASSIPKVGIYPVLIHTIGLVYTYLAGHVGHIGDQGA